MKTKILFLIMMLLLICTIKVYADNKTSVSTNFYITYDNVTSIDNLTGKLSIYYNNIDEDSNQYLKPIRYYIRNNTMYSYIAEGEIGEPINVNNKSFAIQFYTTNISCSDIKLTELNGLMSNISNSLVDCKDIYTANGENSNALKSCDSSLNTACIEKQKVLDSCNSNLTTKNDKLIQSENQAANDRTTITNLTTENKTLSSRWILYMLGGGAMVAIGGYVWYNQKGGKKHVMEGDFLVDDIPIRPKASQQNPQNPAFESPPDYWKP